MRKFEWDEAKNETNKAKHKISFEEACDLIQYTNATVSFKTVMHRGESRELLIGQNRDKRYWTTLITMRGDMTRIISCRRSREEEIEHYEKARN